MLNGWITESFPNGCNIATFGNNPTVYFFNVPFGTTFTLGMNVTFDLDGNGNVVPSSVTWDGSYSKPGWMGIYEGVKI